MQFHNQYRLKNWEKKCKSAWKPPSLQSGEKASLLYFLKEVIFIWIKMLKLIKWELGQMLQPWACYVTVQALSIRISSFSPDDVLCVCDNTSE